MKVVVDTNVAVAASGYASHVADTECKIKCMDRLLDILNRGGLLIDEQGYILEEYCKRLGHSGQPDVGEAFVKWVHDHQAIPKFVQTVPVTPLSGNGWRRFAEFPDRIDLRSFDSDDQKFVAVAIASKCNPLILNAVDSDWDTHAKALEDAGVRVKSLCL